MILIGVILLALFAEAIGREIDFPQTLGLEEEKEFCTNCGEGCAADWLVCPRCQNLLQHHCDGCGRTKISAHRVCPWCGHFGEKGGGGL